MSPPRLQVLRSPPGDGAASVRCSGSPRMTSAGSRGIPVTPDFRSMAETRGHHRSYDQPRVRDCRV